MSQPLRSDRRLGSPLKHSALLLGWLLRWLILLVPVCIATGSAVALFLWLLDWATVTHWENGWLLYLLPLSGYAIYWLYRIAGRNIDRGNNLVMDHIHQPGGGVPLRMAPAVLIGTVLTHLFGGSAGREGTAVQMGGALASPFGRLYRLEPHDFRILLSCGMAAGFGAVFGTPVAGAIFALEVIAIGRMRYDALVPCLLAGFGGDWACTAWGIGHTHYHIPADLLGRVDHGVAILQPILALKVLIAALAFGLVAKLFAECTHTITAISRKLMSPWMRPLVGAVCVWILVLLSGTTDYLGLGVTTQDGSGVSILNAFHTGGAEPMSWLWKLVFTAVTLGSGFKGGEVTPLFFIGATLGNTLAWLLDAPVELFAALGFLAVFAGASNTPLACTFMGIELFGGVYTGYYALACFLAYLFSGHSGIYTAQKIGSEKGPKASHLRGNSLQEIQDDAHKKD